MDAEIVEITDPTCSWAWGTEPKLRRLRWRFGPVVDPRWRLVPGGLVPDQKALDPDFDPVRRAPRMTEYWSRTTHFTGMPYPIGMAWAASSSIDACRGVVAAGFQGPEVQGALLRRLRDQIFIWGRPADTVTRVVAVARTVPGLDAVSLAADVDSPAALEEYDRCWEETRSPNEYVRTLEDDPIGSGHTKIEEHTGRERYVFPTLLFRGPGGERTVPGWKPYEDYEAALEAALPGSTSSPRPDPTPEDAFATWPLLTERELSFLCGEGAKPPAGTVEHDWGAGLVWQTEEAAAAWVAID
jgi:predicted DsbA family dithiol-disulfide isomerase